MQYIINTGNIANDGTGDPLRTAFTDVNLNFNQIWAAGPVGSNIQIANNTIQSTNTNGNLILATNGTGVVAVTASILPDIANVRSVGSSNKRFNTVYTQYLDAQSGSYAGNLYIAGNLLVNGNSVTINTSNLDVANSTITLSAGAPSANVADGSGIVVDGANATLTYSAINNDWESNLPITAPTFYGDGSHLTNVSAVVNASAMTGNAIANTVLYSNLTTVGVLENLSVSGNISTAETITSNSITTGEVTATLFTGNGSGLTNVAGSGIVGSVGNATYATYAGVAETANLAALATQAVNANTALFALSAGNASVAGNAVFAQLANVANTACMADIANAAVVAGFANTIGIQTSITVTGNIVAGGIETDNYYFANGTPVTFGNITVSANSLVNGNANVFLNSDGVLNLPQGVGYSYIATFTGYGSGNAQVGFDLNSNLSGTETVWLAAIINPGSGYSVGQSFTYDSTFLEIPGASLTIGIVGVDVNGSITDISFTQPPLYPPSIYRSGSFIALQADDKRWTFGLDGTLTAPGNITTTGNISANTFYIGNTPFTRTLTVGRAVTPVTVPLSSNNSFNVLTADGSSNVVVYTT